MLHLARTESLPIGIDIVDLYGGDKDADVQKQVAQAQQLLKELAGVID